MKIRTYLITFATFSAADALRITFSLNKNQVQTKYDVDDLFLGITDILYSLFYAIGACLHFLLVGRHNIKETYLKFVLLGTVTGCFFGYFSLFFEDRIFGNQFYDNLTKKTILISSRVLFGFSQFVVWPINLSLVSQYYKPETDGRMIALWGSGWEFGNILSLFVSNFFIYSLQIRWQVTVLLFAAANLSFALMIYFFLQNPGQSYKILKTQKNQDTQTFKEIQDQQNQISLNQEVTQKQFWNFIKQLLKSKQIVVYLIINGVTSGIFLGTLWWLPIYMVGIGKQEISGYMTLMFEVFAIIGSIFIGFIHEENPVPPLYPSLARVKRFIFQSSTFITTGMNILAMLAWIFIQRNIVAYGILIAISGFCIGGLFNSMHSNDVLNYTKNDSLKTEMFAVLILITNNVMTGLTSFLTGLVIEFASSLGLVDQSQSRYKGLLYILLLMTGVDFVLFVVKKFYQKQKKEQKKISNQNPVFGL